MTEVVNKINIDGIEGVSTTRKELADGEYIETVGRRKTAAARVRITPASKNTFTVNGKTLKSYFPTPVLQTTAKSSLSNSGIDTKFNITVMVKGGGSSAQAEAVRHGVSRALVEFDGELRKALKKLGYLKRDPRKKERKKFGLKKARKAPQWSKR
ncbi:MAG: 30S ribosomal protein S9 [Candidatus Pacebacteria bacterium]|nr:30S ribosomal protein S9 [Candidatus Paceibacterota bacterium]